MTKAVILVRTLAFRAPCRSREIRAGRIGREMLIYEGSVAGMGGSLTSKFGTTGPAAGFNG